MTAGEPRLRVLVVADRFFLSAEAGGPARSLHNLIDHLGADIDFSVLTRDRDDGKTSPHPGILTDRWHRGRGCEVQYLSPAKWSWRGLLDAVRSRELDVLYLHSFFGRSVIKCLSLRRAGLLGRCGVVVAPQGQFHAPSLARKRIRKRAYLALARALGLFDGVVVQATNLAEVREARELTGAAIHLAPNLSFVRPQATASRPSGKDRGRASLVFLSSIQPLKNLALVLECVAALGAPADVTFDIWGPIKDSAYWRRCRALMAKLPASVHATYRGAARPDEVMEILARYDFFVLPTRTESHCHAIIEALGAGCPVVISDRTPWRGLTAQGIGWDLPYGDSGALTRVLRECVAMDRARHQRMVDAAVEFYRRRESDPELIRQSRELFAKAVEIGRARGGR